MEQPFLIRPIARIHTDFPTKFGIPRQGGLADSLQAEIVFEPEFKNPDALRGLESHSHIWLIWGFSENIRAGWSPTVRPPRLGGNTRMGVFATRSPFRPNALGLSCVRLETIEYTRERGPVLKVCGADMMDQTPIFDIKPYDPFIDSHPEATVGFAKEVRDYALTVEFPEPWLKKIDVEKRQALFEILSQDPRPAYHKDPERIYGFGFARWEIRFVVKDKLLTVCEVKERESKP